MAEVEKFVKDSEAHVLDMAKQLETIRAMMPIEEMNLEEYFEHFPDQVSLASLPQLYILSVLPVCHNYIYYQSCQFAAIIYIISLASLPQLYILSVLPVWKITMNRFVSLRIIGCILIASYYIFFLYQLNYTVTRQSFIHNWISFNPFVPSVLNWVRLIKISILI